MPSASTKVEIPASSEALDPFKRVLTVVDKKVRNLEKRKLKLDVLKQKKDSGAELEKDQQVAVDRYGEVIQNLEFARDLQKQFQSISTDVEKLLKKQAKRGKSEKQMQEVKRVKEVLQLQGLLDQMGSDTVRKDFQTGKHGAIVLTEENLDQLDELYKLISPTRDNESDYLESLSEASEHIVCLLDAKDKPVVGTTSYKDLKELLDLISQCGYFEKAQATEGVKEGGDVEFEVVEHTDVPAPDSEEVQSSLPPDVQTEEIETKPVATGQQIINNDTLNTQPQVITAQADAFFNTPVSSQTVEEQQQAELAALQQQQRRPFQEIVSSVQGNFNFLQESTIEVEAKREFSPHMDPAVVAAHPMPQSQQSMGRPPSNQTPDTSGLPQTGFGSGATFGEQQSAFGDQQSLDSELSVSKVSHGGSVDQSVYSKANMAPTQDFSGSGFTQSNLSHSLQTDSLFSGTVSSGDSNSGNRGVIGKGESGTIGHPQYEIPPQLPMPPSHEQQAQDNQHQSDPEKKGFPMNPNATEFQSLIYNQSGEEGESSNKSSNDGFQGGTYSNMGYNQREQRGGRGGFSRGRGGNRGGGGGGNMSNGYSRGGRGGNYQGYQSRDNYRGDGFQGGYSGNSYNNGGGFQKRGDSNREGGRGGSSRGGSRGGGQRGGGFNRGGSAGGRGSARGTGQGFGRPNFNQQQT